MGSSVMASCSVVEVVSGHGFGEEEEVDAVRLEGTVVYDGADEVEHGRQGAGRFCSGDASHSGAHGSD
jgi:hypothetical protein